LGETSDRTSIDNRVRPAGPLLVFSVPWSEITETYIGGNAGLRALPSGGLVLG
jgi:hypothetical protein